MNKIVWIKQGRTLAQSEDSVSIVSELPKRIYTLYSNDVKNQIYLEEFADEFKFDFKLYGIETKFINYVLKTYESTTGNLGLLFNGLKGTGKTVTAKIIANKLNLPVIIINKSSGQLLEFISKIECPCVLFFDEFEKTFPEDENDITLLSLMDGVNSNPYRKVFIFTTNNPTINPNLISRPSRIRYAKTFTNLNPEVVKEYIKDNLIYPEYTNDILRFVDTLSLLTIDILKSIVDEVNMHNRSPQEFSEFFNVTTSAYVWSIQYKRIYGKSYSFKEFANELKSIGKTEKDAYGDEFVITPDYLDMHTTRCSTTKSLKDLQVGDSFGNFDTITSIDVEKGFITTSDGYKNYYIQVLNASYTPSLYKGALI